MDNIKIDIGLSILEGRIKTNMTQKKLASLVGTKQSAISSIERGARMPSLSMLNKIAKAFKTYLIPPDFGLLRGTTYTQTSDWDLSSSN